MSVSSPSADELTEFKHQLLAEPSSQLDASMRPLIVKWSEPPKAIEVLEVLDKCIHAALASELVVRVLQILYELVCENENTTHEVVVLDAKWRT